MTKLRIFCPKCDHEFFYRGLMHWIRDSSDRRAACGVSIRSLNVSTDPKKARCSKCKEKAEYAGLKALRLQLLTRQSQKEYEMALLTYLKERGMSMKQLNDCHVLEQGPDTTDARKGNA